MKTWMSIFVIAMMAPLGLADAVARTVKYHDQDIVAIKAKLRYTTLVELPAQEKIVQAATGDKDFWIIDAVENFCFLHPAKSGIHSNLNLITEKGRVYSFTLDEGPGDPDLKVIIEPSGRSALTSLDGPSRFVPSADIEAYRVQAQLAHRQAEEAIAQFKSEYPTKDVKFDYAYHDRKPFAILAIYHDDQFTYVKSAASEKFALYEMKDNKPSVVNFELRDGTYVVTKIVDKGYLQIGKKRLKFERKP